MGANGMALKRPAPPAKISPAAQVKQRQLDPADPLRVALGTLQLARVPGSIKELAAVVGGHHPQPEHSWSWDLAAAYRAVFDAICQASGSAARATGGPGPHAV
jgi:hypothetical protein